MKKFLMVLSTFGLITAIMAGCGTDTKDSQSSAPDNKATEVATTQTPQSEPAAADKTAAEQKDAAQTTATPTEPGDGEMCSMCNMEVYHQDHEMGKFTGQVVTADGKHLFTDDVGCLLNQIRTLEEKPQGAWVRDYNTLEWVPVNDATPVRASIETPMKMGFALFATKEAADKYVAENPMAAPVITSMDDVDKIALERRKAKLAKMKESEEKAKAAGKMNGQMDMQMNGQMK
ncbi:nitrous oxide reductase accessory protein NosL [Schinkia sp. CFF1]